MSCPDCEKRIQRNLDLDLKNMNLVNALVNLRKKAEKHPFLISVSTAAYIDKVIEKNNLNEVKKETK